MRGAADSAATLAKVNDLASKLITPPIRYSQPELQTHITYLYSVTTATDQKIGRDVIDRFQGAARGVGQEDRRSGSDSGKVARASELKSGHQAISS